MVAEQWLAALRRVRGEYSEALQLQENVIAAAAKTFGANSEIHLARVARAAEIELTMNRDSAARERLNFVKAHARLQDGKLSPSMLAAERLLIGIASREARPLQANGAAALDDALALQARAERDFAAGGADPSLRIWDRIELHRLVAEVARRSERFEVMKTNASQLVTQLIPLVAAVSPQLASDRALLAIALARTGDRPRAKTLAREARAALATTPNVAPHFGESINSFEKAFPN